MCTGDLNPSLEKLYPEENGRLLSVVRSHNCTHEGDCRLSLKVISWGGESGFSASFIADAEDSLSTLRSQHPVLERDRIPYRKLKLDELFSSSSSCCSHFSKIGCHPGFSTFNKLSLAIRRGVTSLFIIISRNTQSVVCERRIWRARSRRNCKAICSLSAVGRSWLSLVNKLWWSSKLAFGKMVGEVKESRRELIVQTWNSRGDWALRGR